MSFTIEPMLNLGGPDLYLWDDDWTALDRRRLPLGPVRAHHGGHPRRRRDHDQDRLGHHSQRGLRRTVRVVPGPARLRPVAPGSAGWWSLARSGTHVAGWCRRAAQQRRRGRRLDRSPGGSWLAVAGEACAPTCVSPGLPAGGDVFGPARLRARAGSFGFSGRTLGAGARRRRVSACCAAAALGATARSACLRCPFRRRRGGVSADLCDRWSACWARRLRDGSSPAGSPGSFGFRWSNARCGTHVAGGCRGAAQQRRITP